MSTVEKSIRLYAWKTNYHTFRIVQGEVDSRHFNIQLFSTTIPVNLTDCHVSLFAVKPDSTKSYIDCEVVDAELGLVKVTLTDQVAAVDGIVDCWIQVVSDAGTDLRFEGMNIEVSKCRLTEDVESSDEFPALLEAISEVRPAAARANEAADKATIAATNAGTFGTYAKNQGDAAKQAAESVGAVMESANAAAITANAASKSATAASNLANDTVAELKAARERGDLNGQSAYDFAKEDGYQGTEEEYAEDMNPDRLKAELEQIEVPEIVSSKDFMTDRTKHYVFDGYIYSLQKVATGGGMSYPNRFKPSTAILNKRLSGSGGSWGSNNSSVGYFGVDNLLVPNYSSNSPYNLVINYELPYSSNGGDDSKIVFRDSSGTRVGHCFIMPDGGNVKIADGKTIVDLRKFHTQGGGVAPDVSKVTQIALQLVLTPGTAVTSAQLENIEIYLEVEGTYNEPTITYEWKNSGIHYAPTFRTDIVGVLGEGNVIYLSDNALPPGTYSLKFADNDYMNVGMLVKE